MTPTSDTRSRLLRENVRIARKLYPNLTSQQLAVLRDITFTFGFRIAAGDILSLDGKWYITHPGLLGLSRRRRCAAINTSLESAVSDPAAGRWVFKAIAFKKGDIRGFVGYGDANPSNVSSLVHGAEMRVAETRAVNRALRKAYGIGICSVEEIGSFSPPSPRTHNNNEKRPPKRVNGHGSNAQPRLRDQLCQLIREHGLDPLLVKSYALDFCGTQNLNQATREQIQNFIAALSDQAKKDKPSLLCQLNSYSQPKQEGAA